MSIFVDTYVVLCGSKVVGDMDTLNGAIGVALETLQCEPDTALTIECPDGAAISVCVDYSLPEGHWRFGDKVTELHVSRKAVLSREEIGKIARAVAFSRQPLSDVG